MIRREATDKSVSLVDMIPQYFLFAAKAEVIR